MSSEVTAYILYAIPALLVAISLHETMHSVTGYWLGDDTAKILGRISFNPLKHIDPLTTVALPLIMVALGQIPFAIARPVPVNFARLKYEEFGMALVGIAGPLTNLLLGIVSVFLLKLASPSLLNLLADGRLAITNNYFANFLGFSVLMNFGLFVFNMIPFPPLDGSRVLYAFAPEFLQKLMERIEQMGFTAIILFMLLAFPAISPIVAAFNIGLIRFFAG
jgi:Zn-dependent protease